MNDSRTIRTIAEIEISFELREDFREDLENQLAGEYIADDKRYTRELIEDVEKHCPRDWKPETKREFLRYITCRAELYVESQQKGA